ncbi:hypothetical protein XAP412_1430001 [Xanthomonas phaseoli pv. phaseoli]|uniref:Uncharacterized protein n=1 Tax=Xanthomonas campestris pv. phaseoli TaxID=317013 RepID=A0AB38DX01_XANCH|nr:hypothetical protein XAP6984_1570001 [Xanthomonas phaseoli pv. phaseoli]SON80384.1 hypothetical protein XAP412_1430001 [Xanthomonas phaseoli pv. phaseoli]SON83976.1 hypothetical protein XAP7430_1500004 [Xanthomonas phaseoli pv. phaseoli]
MAVSCLWPGYTKSRTRPLRVYRHGSLIHPEWSSCFINHRGALVTAEGREIRATDLDWLSLLFRRAEMMGPLLRERDQLQRRLQEVEQASAGEAGRGLGLVYSSTSDTHRVDSLQHKAFSGLPILESGTIMAPNWHLKSSKWHHVEDTDGTAQPSATAGREGGASGLCGWSWNLAQRGCDLGYSQFLAVRDEAGSSLRRGCSQGPQIEGPVRCASPNCRAGIDSQAGWSQRGVPVFQRQKGEALPPRVDLNHDASRNVGGAV